MARNGYCCGVDTWHTLSIVISFSTCTFQYDWLAVAKKITTICVVFNFVCGWIVVENIVRKMEFSINVSLPTLAYILC